MLWQDIVISLALAVLDGGLVPALRSDSMKPPLRASAISAVAMAAIIIPDLSLGIYLGAALTALGMAFWATLFIQVLRRDYL